MRITPSRFYADPLGWLDNQVGHMFIAGVAAAAISYGWFWLTGDLPYRLAIWAAITVIYLAVELPQRGGLWDTVEDIVFVCIHGPLLYIAPFKEAEAGSLALNFAGLGAVAPYLGLVLAHLATGGGVRLWQAHKEGRDL